MKAATLNILLTLVCFSLDNSALAADATPAAAAGGTPQNQTPALSSFPGVNPNAIYGNPIPYRQVKTCDDLMSKYEDDINSSEKDMRDQQYQLHDKQKDATADQKSAWDQVSQDQKDIAQAGADFHSQQTDDQQKILDKAKQTQADQSKIQADLTSTQNSLPILQTVLAQANSALATAQTTFDSNYVRLQCMTDLQSKFPKATSARGSASVAGGEIQWINQTWSQCVKTEQAKVAETINSLQLKIAQAQEQLTSANAQITQDKTSLQQAQTQAQQQSTQDTTAQNQAKQDYMTKVQGLQSKMSLDQANAQQVAMQSQQALAQDKQLANTNAFAGKLQGDIQQLKLPHSEGGPNDPAVPCCTDTGYLADSDDRVIASSSTNPPPLCPDAGLTQTSSAPDSIESITNSLMSGLDRLSASNPANNMNFNLGSGGAL